MAQQLGSFEKVLRVGEGRRLKRLAEQAAYIGTLEPEFEQLSDEELAGKTAEFRERFANGETLDELLFEAFAAVREAFKRTMGVRLFDVQLMGGIVLHEGDIAEMKTGEGKTFVATQALYLNAIAGNGVHLVTTNDYLAQRDRAWTAPVFEALGMRTAFIENMMAFEPRRDAYLADVTYGTNSEFGFDYLRDNMSVSLDGIVQRGHQFAIVDEVDSILVDEARTPLIISGEPETAAQLYYDFARVVPNLVGHRSSPGDPKGAAEAAGADFEYDEKHKTVAVTEPGVEKVERALRIENLYAPQNSQLVNHLVQALKAQSLYHRDVEYVIEGDEVKIVDEFTGRIMEGRRWSEGLHQAVEAKEGVRIQEEHLTLATITLQNYFRLYEKLGGMTGTAKTEEKEFVEIYNLHVVEIPTNVPVARLDKHDLVFKTKEGKFEAVARDIKERVEKGQPVLVGTIAVETSEYLSRAAEQEGRQAHRAEREGARARGGDHRRRRPARRGHDRDEHGGPRRRHQAGGGRQGSRRPLRPRHRAPRVAPHRQPAPRPLGPPGRPRRDALLSLRRGRPRAPVRRRPDQGDHGAVQDPGGPADGGEDPQPPDRGRAEEGRGAELRHAQERPQVRRRAQPAPRPHLRAAPPGARGRRHVGAGEALDRRPRRGHRQHVHGGRVLRGVGSRGADERGRADVPDGDHGEGAAAKISARTSRARRSSRSSRPTHATSTRRRRSSSARS